MDSNDEKEILHRLTVVEERGKSNTYRIDELSDDIETVKILEVKLDENAREIKKLKEDNAVIYKLASNIEITNHHLNRMGEENKKYQDENNKKMDIFTNTFSKMNENLSELSQSHQQMSNDMQNMKKDITSTKSHIEEVEKLAQTNKENMSFNIVKFFTSDGTKILLTAIIVAILSFIGLK